jgi:VWFA-related protein
MFFNPGLCGALVETLLCTAVMILQSSPQTPASNGRIYLDVAVTQKSGAPVTGLQHQDFTVLDNKAPQTITSFEPVTAREVATEIILVVDAINATSLTVDGERAQVDKFLRADGGHLRCPTVVVVVTDTGTHILGAMSRDGNVLSAELQKEVIGFGTIHGTAVGGASERLQISLGALHRLIAMASPTKGRSAIFWVSPGWPMRMAANSALTSKEQQGMFADIVSLTTQLQRARLTLYSIDPRGTSEPITSAVFYEEFLKGISKPNQVELGNLALQVFAVQSGGLVFNSTNDIVGALQKCVADSESFYTLSFESAAAKKQDEYHRIELQLAKPGLIARTRQVYYAQPLPGN